MGETGFISYLYVAPGTCASDEHTIILNVPVTECMLITEISSADLTGLAEEESEVFEGQIAYVTI